MTPGAPHDKIESANQRGRDCFRIRAPEPQSGKVQRTIYPSASLQTDRSQFVRQCGPTGSGLSGLVGSVADCPGCRRVLCHSCAIRAGLWRTRPVAVAVRRPPCNDGSCGNPSWLLLAFLVARMVGVTCSSGGPPRDSWGIPRLLGPFGYSVTGVCCLAGTGFQSHVVAGRCPHQFCFPVSPSCWHSALLGNMLRCHFGSSGRRKGVRNLFNDRGWGNSLVGGGAFARIACKEDHSFAASPDSRLTVPRSSERSRFRNANRWASGVLSRGVAQFDLRYSQLIPDHNGWPRLLCNLGLAEASSISRCLFGRLGWLLGGEAPSAGERPTPAELIAGKTRNQGRMWMCFL